TPIARAVATAASTALPPACRISSPASAANGCIAVIMPCSATASRLSISHWLCVRSTCMYRPCYVSVGRQADVRHALEPRCAIPSGRLVEAGRDTGQPTRRGQQREASGGLQELCARGSHFHSGQRLCGAGGAHAVCCDPGGTQVSMLDVRAVPIRDPPAPGTSVPHVALPIGRSCRVSEPRFE